MTSNHKCYQKPGSRNNFTEKTSTGRGNVGNNETNIKLAYLWIKFHSTVDTRQIQKISHIIKKVFKLKYCKLKQFQELSGNLQHVSYGIPGGKGLFLPIYLTMKMVEGDVKITPYLVAVLKGWQILVHHLAENPTPAQILVSEYPD